MKNKAYLGIDIGSISTKGVIIDDSNNIIARSNELYIIISVIQNHHLKRLHLNFLRILNIIYFLVRGNLAR